MKVSKMLTVAALAAATLSACTNPKEQEKKQLEEKVMAVHDEVMPKMGTIRNLQNTLKGMVATEMEDTASIDSAMITMAETHQQALEDAHNAMMDWMAAYNPPTAEQTAEDAVNYLQEQEVSVNEMATQMKTAISEATAFVEKNGGTISESNNDEHNHEEHNHHEGHNHH